MKEITSSLLDNFFKNNDSLAHLKSQITQCVEQIVTMHKSGKKMLLCGNGGSAADCQHICGELMKSFVLKRPVPETLRDELAAVDKINGDYIADGLQQGVKAIPLVAFEAYETAFCNDCNSKLVFAQAVNVLGEKDDVLFAISTSGNSENVVLAATVAKAKGLKVVALTGESGGKLKNYADVLINVPSNTVYKIQEIHLPVYHLICMAVENELF